MPAFIIPTTPTNQIFSVSLANVTYNIRMLWSNIGQYWVVDISDANGVPLVQGIPLVAGADLLQQFRYLGIGGALVAQSTVSTNNDPSFTDLGTVSQLYFVTT